MQLLSCEGSPVIGRAAPGVFLPGCLDRGTRVAFDLLRVEIGLFTIATRNCQAASAYCF